MFPGKKGAIALTIRSFDTIRSLDRSTHPSEHYDIPQSSENRDQEIAPTVFPATLRTLQFTVHLIQSRRAVAPIRLRKAPWSRDSHGCSQSVHVLLG